MAEERNEIAAPDPYGFSSEESAEKPAPKAKKKAQKTPKPDDMVELLPATPKTTHGLIGPLSGLRYKFVAGGTLTVRHDDAERFVADGGWKWR